MPTIVGGQAKIVGIAAVSLFEKFIHSAVKFICDNRENPLMNLAAVDVRVKSDATRFVVKPKRSTPIRSEWSDQLVSRLV